MTEGVRLPNIPLATAPMAHLVGIENTGGVYSVRKTPYADVLATGLALGAVLHYATRALLFADLAHAAGSLARVYEDTTAAYNGIYKKAGASGSGSWSRIADSPSSIIPLTVTGGTANAIVATAPETPSLPGNKIYFLTPTAPNTTAVTIVVNGQPAVAIKNAFGVALAADSLLANNAVLMVWSVDHYQLVVSASVDASAILAAAQAAQVAAAASAVDAAASASVVDAETTATAADLNTHVLSAKWFTTASANRPGPGNWMVEVQRINSDSNYVRQIATSPSGVMATRRREAGTWSQWRWLQPTYTFRPGDYGAVEDDGGLTSNSVAAFNLMFDALRAHIATTESQTESYYHVDLSGRWRVTSSINATNLQAVNLLIENGHISGATSGRPIMDLSGSRMYEMRKVMFYGESVNRPSSAWQAAPTVTTGACDDVLYHQCTTRGWFSVAAVDVFGQETTTHIHGKYWNRAPEGYLMILAGYRPGVTSDFDTIYDDPTFADERSFINCEYHNLDCRYDVAPGYGNAVTVTGITKANPAVVTAAAHGMTNGMTVTMASIGGMTEMNNVTAVISGVTTDTFAMTGINSSAFSTFTSGGLAIRAHVGAIYFTHGSDHHFHACYVVGVGAPAVHFDFPLGTNGRFDNYRSTFHFHFEGWGLRNYFYISPGTGIANFINCDFSTLAVQALTSAFFGTNANAGGFVRLRGGSVDVATPATFTLLDNAANYRMYGTRLSLPIVPTLPATFKGIVYNSSTDAFEIHKATLVA